MKASKILAVGALAFAFVASAQATTVIRIGGSSAYRTAAVAAIEAMLTSPVEKAYSNDGTSAAGANAANITGTLTTALNDNANGDGTGNTILAAGESMLIKCSWTGSAGGIDNVANSSVSGTRKFMVDSVTGAVDMSVAANVSATEVPDIAFSDVATSSAGVSFVESGNAGCLGNVQSTNVDPVGVIPFKWLISSGPSASISTTGTNMTSQIVRALAPAGKIKLKAFTGVITDNSYVLLTGRDPDSGTRITALGEAGFSPATAVQQWVTSKDGTSMWDGKIANGTPTSKILAPTAAVNSHSFSGGNSGFASGGTLAASLMFTTGSNVAVAYLSVGDAGTALTGTTGQTATIREMTYNGIPFSVDNVKNGKYTFWTFEHMYYRTTDAQDGGNATAFIGSFAEQLAVKAAAQPSQSAGKYLNVNDLNVTRAADADVITPWVS